MMTQHQKIMELLEHNQWVCTNSFYAQFIADPRKRLEELRKQGIKMEWRWCQNEEHNHKGHSKEWRLIEESKKQEIPLYEMPEYYAWKDSFNKLTSQSKLL